MNVKPTVAIIGPGRLGSALARALHAADYRIDEIVFRCGGRSQRVAPRLAREVGAVAVPFEEARHSSAVTWLCVADSDLVSCAVALAVRDWKSKIALHTSGALPSDVLAPLLVRGAAIASVHPMMSFVRTAHTNMRGVVFGLEGDPRATRQARRMVADLGGRALTIRKEAKPLYHAFGAFTSPLLIAALAAGERVAAAAGLSAKQARAAAAPILEQTVRNYVAHGAAAAFSGPLVRGDVDTVRKHLAALRAVPEARDAYVALVQSALRTLPVKNAREMGQLLDSTRRHENTEAARKTKKNKSAGLKRNSNSN